MPNSDNRWANDLDGDLPTEQIDTAHSGIGLLIIQTKVAAGNAIKEFDVPGAIDDLSSRPMSLPIGRTPVTTSFICSRLTESVRAVT